jgi:hypothetical protein
MTKLNLQNFQTSNELVIIYISNDTDYSHKQLEKLQARQSEFLEKGADLIMVENSKASADGLYPKLKEKQQGILVTNATGELLWHKFELSYLDLAQSMIDFIAQYQSDVSGLDLLGWGNKILEEGDYMCNDCGYILTVKTGGEFEPGMVFPTCDVCQSGEPEGPTGTLEPFWQKL